MLWKICESWLSNLTFTILRLKPNDEVPEDFKLATVSGCGETYSVTRHISDDEYDLFLDENPEINNKNPFVNGSEAEPSEICLEFRWDSYVI